MFLLRLGLYIGDNTFRLRIIYYCETQMDKPKKTVQPSIRPLAQQEAFSNLLHTQLLIAVSLILETSP